MIQINYFMSHGSPWTFLGHNRLGNIIKKFNVKLNMYPVNYGEIFPISGGLPVSKRSPQRQKMRLQELKRWSEFLRVNLIPQPTFFPSKSILPSLIIIAAKIQKTNKDFDLAQNIMNALWVQDLDIDDENILSKILRQTDLSSKEILSCAKSEVCKNLFEEYTNLAIKENVFGAPTYILEDQVYWGQDRLEFVERHLSNLI